MNLGSAGLTACATKTLDRESIACGKFPERALAPAVAGLSATIGRVPEKAEMNLGSPGLTACATKTLEVAGE
jgi:hypothetical protein